MKIQDKLGIMKPVYGQDFRAKFISVGLFYQLGYFCQGTLRSQRRRPRKFLLVILSVYSEPSISNFFIRFLPCIKTPLQLLRIKLVSDHTHCNVFFIPRQLLDFSLLTEIDDFVHVRLSFGTYLILAPLQRLG